MSTKTKEQRAAEKAALNLSNEEFRARLAELANQHKKLLKLSAAVNSAPKGEVLDFSGLGINKAKAVVGRKELQSLSSQFQAELKSLYKNYKEHGSASKKKSTRKGSGGFKSNPIVIDDTLKEFIRNGNFGYQTPGNPASGRLQDHPAVQQILENGITTRSALTPLFMIYMRVNNLQAYPEEQNMLRADATMRQYFNQTFTELENLPPRTNKKGEALPVFNRERFRIPTLSQVISKHVIPKETLPADWKQALDNEATKQQAIRAQEQISSVNDQYK